MASKPWKTLAKLVVSLLAAGVLVAGVAMPVVLGSGILARQEASRFLSTTCNLQESAPPQKTYMYASDGKTLIATLFSQDRQIVPLTKTGADGKKIQVVPQYLQDALVATEDRRFYSHHGVDLRGLIRSAVSTGSGDTQGGSTLTMQYVKQIRYFQAGDDLKKQQAAVAQTLQRKIEDAKCALYFEGAKGESKSTILKNYLNIAFFGEHAYGIQTAARTYFNESVTDLNLAQSAMLVGLLRAPGYYDPFTNPSGAKARRDEVIQNLVAVGKLSQPLADQAKQTPLSLYTSKPPTVQEGCANAPTTVKNVAFFCDYAKTWLEKVNGLTEQQLNTGGYKIITTLDPKIQDTTQAAIAKDVSSKSQATAVLPVLDPKSGDVLAMASSKSFGSGKGQTEQPIFTSTTAFGASTFKLFPLLTALSTGIPSTWQLKTIGNTGVYKPSKCPDLGAGVRNGDDNVQYNPIESLSSATAKSDNSYFVSLAENALGCQLQPVVDVMTKLNITGLSLPGDRGQTVGQTIVSQQRAQQLVLGSVAVSPLQLAGAYGMVAAGGVYHAPSPITSITDSSGQAVTVKRTAGTQVVAPQVAAQAVKILKGDTQKSADGTSADAFASWYTTHNSVVAGKTGTVEADQSVKKYKNKNAAIWFVGMTPDIVAASGLVNYDSTAVPSPALKSLIPGSPNLKAGEAYGSYTASLWLDALKPTLTKRQWSWPDPDSLPGTSVPDVAGQTQSDAKKNLADAGFKMSVLGAADNAHCASSEPFESVGYFGPQKAVPGSTITVCLSTQQSAQPVIYYPPLRTTPRRGTGSSGTTRSGGASAPASGGAGSSAGNGGGNGNGAGNGGGGGASRGPGRPVPSPAPR